MTPSASPRAHRGRPDLTLTQPLVEELASIIETDAAAERAEDDSRPEPDVLSDGPAERSENEGAECAEDSAHSRR